MSPQRNAVFISHATPENNAFTLWLGAKLAALAVMTDFAKQKAAKLGQDPKRLFSIETTLAERRDEEQYCLRYVECISPLLQKNEVATGSMFSGCLKDEAKEKYDLQERK